MKKITLTILIALLSVTAFSQRFVGAGIAGFNLTQIDGDQIFGYHKVGFNGGASVMVALDAKQRWFLTMELLYNQKGSYRKALVDSMIYVGADEINESVPYNKKVKYKVNLDYVEVPLLAHFEDPKTGVAFGVGFSWARLVRAKELESGYTLYTDLQTKTYRTNDWSAIADVKIRVWKGLKLNFRFQYSMTPIRIRTYTNKNSNESWERKQYHNILSLRVIYAFNERYTVNTKKNKFGERIGTKWVRDLDNPNY